MGYNVSDEIIVKNPTVSAAAYSAGHNVGGLITLEDAVSLVGAALLKSLTVVDRANQKAALTLLFFSGTPAGTITDKAAYVITSADAAKLIGIVNVLTTDYTTIEAGATDVAIATIKNIDMMLQNFDTDADGNIKAAGQIYVVIVTSGTPTYVATSDLFVKFGIQRGNIGAR